MFLESPQFLFCTLCACTVCDVRRGLDLLGMVGSAHSPYVTAGCFCRASMCSCDVCCPCTAWVGMPRHGSVVECRVVVLEPRVFGMQPEIIHTCCRFRGKRVLSGHASVTIHCFQHKHTCAHVVYLWHVSAGWRLLHGRRQAVIGVCTAGQQQCGTPVHPW